MNLDLKKALDLYLGGLFILTLRPIVILLGKILGRNHTPIPKGDITIIKLQGGGSLVIGLSALLAIKKSYPNQNLQILTTKAIAPFARSLGVFDKVLVIDDSNLISLFASSTSNLIKLFATDTIVDWEVYSRLTTIYALFTCARNRLGFYREDVKSRKNFSTHLVYFNLYFGAYHFYNDLSELMGCKIPSNDETQKYFMDFIKPYAKFKDNLYRIGVGAGCSELSPERMLTSEQWKIFAQKNLTKEKSYEITFFGGPADKSISDSIASKISELNLNVKFNNTCGVTKLDESIKNLHTMDEYWGVDSALLHYARLMGIKTHAFFGPTSPISLLKPLDYITEEIHYKQVPCSPCVHVTETPPCEGNNKCIKNLFS